MPKKESEESQGSSNQELKIAVGDVVRWGKTETVGVVQAIRVIDSAQNVSEFCGDREDIVLTIRDTVGTAFIWAKDETLVRLDDHQAQIELKTFDRKRR